MKPPATQYLKYIVYFAILVIVLRFFNTLNGFALNLPFEDDYDAILKFLVNYKDASGGEKLKLLLSQHNEHRMLPARIVYVLQYMLTGTVNFRTLIFIANVQLLVILGLGIFFIRRAFEEVWYLPAFVFGICLFDLNNFGNSNFAMAGMSNYSVIMFFFLSLFALELNTRKSILLSIPLQLLCIFSSGAGMAACCMLIVYSLLDRNRFKTIVCSVTSVCGIALYFTAYTSSNNQLMSTDPMWIVQYFLHLVGGHFGYEIGIVAGIGVLFVLLFTLPANWRLQFRKGSIPLFTVLLFIMASISIVAIFRSNDKMVHSYSSRFLIYPNLLAALAFCFLLLKVQSQKIKLPLSVCTVLLFLWVYNANFEYGLQNLELQKRRLTYTEFYYGKGRDDEARQITEAACKEEIYCIQDNR